LSDHFEKKLAIGQSSCDALLSISQYVKEWMLRQDFVKEESLTDWITYQVSNEIAEITYSPFSRNEEGQQTGADWHWWFLFPNFSFELRVQAKKLKSPGYNSRSIKYTNDAGKSQIEMLLIDATSVNAMPFYVFYCSDVFPSSCMLGRGIRDGVFLAPAKEIYEKFVLPEESHSASSEDLIKGAVPLSCFLCCPFGNLLHKDDPAGSPDPDFIGFLRNYFPSSIVPKGGPGKNLTEGKPTDIPDNEILGFHDSVPIFVESFLNVGKKEIESWEKKFQSEVQGISGMMVLDLRSIRSKK
jgi:hypothetical protein